MKISVILKRPITAILAAAIVWQSLSGMTFAEAADAPAVEDIIFYQSTDLETQDAFLAAQEPETASGVTQEMCTAAYWYDKNQGSGIAAESPLITADEIGKLNDEMLAAPGANMNDLEKLDSPFNADKLRLELVSGINAPNKKEIYVDQKLLEDRDAWYKNLSNAVYATGYTDESRDDQYAVAIRRTTIRSIPSSAYVGWSATDSDDETVSSALNINEPFVIRQKADVDGTTYYWGYANNCTGWVAASDLAICADKAEWLDSFKVDPGKNDFIVVTQNQIRLEPSVYAPELSEVKLTFGTILKLVPDDKRPAKIVERGTWNNHVVYLPTRNTEGRYVKRIALISQHYDVSIGFSELTQANLLRIAFGNLGDRYGWGGMLDSMDCSLYTRNVYRCFGLEIPRNTTWQQTIPDRKIDLSEKSEDEKLAALSRMPAGTLLYFPGHTMIYIGTAPSDSGERTPKDMAFVISDTGSLSDSTGELDVRSMYSVIVNPLSVRRRSGNTWLHDITAAVLPISKELSDFVRQNTDAPAPSPSIKRVPAGEGQTYGSSKDTLPLETFLGTTKNTYISFSQVDESGVEKLMVTAVKGTKITTKSPVETVLCDNATASVKIGKTGKLAKLTLKKSGDVTFNMADGKSYTVSFTVETPKARTKKVKDMIKESAKDDGTGVLSLDVSELFGTQIDSGTLIILSQKKKNSTLDGNVLTLDTRIKNSIKIRYKYLDKKYTMTINI
ncbi:MAG: C40 family peptidase [Lachnospiraceae bacterium]|nr:C40 family peptidase [Lachnospiraceae bacterium]